MRPRRASTLEATRAAARTAAAARWTAALEHAGWSTWEDAGAWAKGEHVGWAAIAARMGTAQTATRRAGEAAGVRLGRALSARTAAMLDAARAHAAEHGDLTRTTGDLARWLAIRRYAYTGSDVDRALDKLDPAWRDRRRA